MNSRPQPVPSAQIHPLMCSFPLKLCPSTVHRTTFPKLPQRCIVTARFRSSFRRTRSPPAPQPRRRITEIHHTVKKSPPPKTMSRPALQGGPVQEEQEEGRRPHFQRCYVDSLKDKCLQAFGELWAGEQCPMDNCHGSFSDPLSFANHVYTHQRDTCQVRLANDKTCGYTFGEEGRVAHYEVAHGLLCTRGVHVPNMQHCNQCESYQVGEPAIRAHKIEHLSPALREMEQDPRCLGFQGFSTAYTRVPTTWPTSPFPTSFASAPAMGLSPPSNTSSHRTS